MHHHAIVRRDYLPLLAKARHAAPLDRLAAMERLVKDLWAAFADRHVSWVGFYEKSAGDEMVLVCREPKPACSPIGLQGMCGRGWKDRRPIIIDDVRTLGENYIACDPRDQSELVIPVLNDDGSCWGVLDVDSYDLRAFDEHDVREMSQLLVDRRIASPAIGDLVPLRL
jgi:putative methionine-R-sulfoxide reductase with GAF domain